MKQFLLATAALFLTLASHADQFSQEMMDVPGVQNGQRRAEVKLENRDGGYFLVVEMNLADSPPAGTGPFKVLLTGKIEHFFTSEDQSDAKDMLDEYGTKKFFDPFTIQVENFSQPFSVSIPLPFKPDMEAYYRISLIGGVFKQPSKKGDGDSIRSRLEGSDDILSLIKLQADLRGGEPTVVGGDPDKMLGDEGGFFNIEPATPNFVRKRANIMIMKIRPPETGDVFIDNPGARKILKRDLEMKNMDVW